jgi:ribokinase
MRCISQPRIVVIGSSNTDLVLPLPRLPRPGESLPEGADARHAGGKGANQAVAAARAGAEVTFIGARGEDDFGRAAAGGLEAEGIDIRHFHVIPGTNSGTALIFIGADDGQNMIGVARSANDHLRASHVHAASGAFTRAQAALAQLETPLRGGDGRRTGGGAGGHSLSAQPSPRVRPSRAQTPLEMRAHGHTERA